MKKLSLVLLALAVALAVTPAAMASPVSTNIGFTFTDLSNNVIGSGSLDVVPVSGQPGTYLATSASGTFTDGGTPATLSLIANPNPPNTASYPGFNYDNLVTPGNTVGYILDYSGLLFPESNGLVLNLWGNSTAGPGTDTWYESNGANGNPGGTFNVTGITVPEPSMAFLIFPAFMGIVGIRRKLAK